MIDKKRVLILSPNRELRKWIYQVPKRRVCYELHDDHLPLDPFENASSPKRIVDEWIEGLEPRLSSMRSKEVDGY
jgi:hypothetical protein